MEIQCECGKFRADLVVFPKNTPGRLVCYCDDCQAYLNHLKRADLLDANGGTEVIPVYPADIKFLSGQENLKCTQITPKGPHRFSTTCCNTPFANVRNGKPWVGIHRRMHTAKDPNRLDQMLGAVRASIMGRFAKGTPPPGTPATYNLTGFACVMPFMIKGNFLKKFKPSPFYREDGVTPVVSNHVLSESELKAARGS